MFFAAIELFLVRHNPAGILLYFFHSHKNHLWKVIPKEVSGTGLWMKFVPTLGYHGRGIPSGMARDPNHEHRQGYEASLGRELGGVFAELWQEVAWLHTVWQEYRVIFGDSPGQLDISNEAAGTFFYMVQKEVWEAVLLHLARLTDPASTRKKKNLAIPALQKLVKPEIAAEVSALTQNCLDSTEFARDWRNRYIAHKDLPLALGDQTAPPLKAASRKAVEEALSSLDELVSVTSEVPQSNCSGAKETSPGLSGRVDQQTISFSCSIWGDSRTTYRGETA
jgi:hypothetical protein